MGCGVSKTTEPEDDVTLTKLGPNAVGKNEPTVPLVTDAQRHLKVSDLPSNNAANGSAQGSLKTEATEADGGQPGDTFSRQESLKPQTSRHGGLGPTGVYIPSSGFRTRELCAQLTEKYDMPSDEVDKAMDFAESEEFVDVYCFTYCITGGPMDPTAFKVAGLQGMDKEAILQCNADNAVPIEDKLSTVYRATAPGNEDLRVLNAEEQKRHKRARDDFLISQALQPDQEENEEKPEDIEDLTEAYRIRFEADTENMTLEEVMEYFGVPDVSKVAIHKHLHPARGSATASVDEIARRKAAHPIALERFDLLS